MGGLFKLAAMLLAVLFAGMLLTMVADGAGMAGSGMIMAVVVVIVIVVLAAKMLR